MSEEKKKDLENIVQTVIKALQAQSPQKNLIGEFDAVSSNPQTGNMASPGSLNNSIGPGFNTMPSYSPQGANFRAPPGLPTFKPGETEPRRFFILLEQVLRDINMPQQY